MGKLSEILIDLYMKGASSNVIDMGAVIESNEFMKEIDSGFGKKLDEDPSHKAYMVIQNMLSYFAEEVSVYEGFEEYYDAMGAALDSYSPSFPPMSPLTSSYFTFWSFCDFRFGEDKETIGSIFYDLGEKLDFDLIVQKGLEKLNVSYMGFYEHQGFEDDLLILRAIETEACFYCICRSGYKGKKGDLIYARLAGNLDGIYDYKIMLTTPYIILKYGSEDWLSFFSRQLGDISQKSFAEKLYRFLKHPLDPNYWHEYLLDGYVNFQSDSIYLTGIPDISGSKPHEM